MIHRTKSEFPWDIETKYYKASVCINVKQVVPSSAYHCYAQAGYFVKVQINKNIKKSEDFCGIFCSSTTPHDLDNTKAEDLLSGPDPVDSLSSTEAIMFYCDTSKVTMERYGSYCEFFQQNSSTIFTCPSVRVFVTNVTSLSRGKKKIALKKKEPVFCPGLIMIMIRIDSAWGKVKEASPPVCLLVVEHATDQVFIVFCFWRRRYIF